MEGRASSWQGGSARRCALRSVRRPGWFRIAIAACVAGLLAWGPAHGAQSVIDGELWLKSTEGERRAFLIGVTAMLGMETAYAEKHGAAPPPLAAMTARALEKLTLDQISSRITRWYHIHADRRDTPVIAVLWLDIVEPAGKRGETKDDRR